MNDDRKLWVIEDNEEPEITSLGEAFAEPPAPASPRPAPLRRAAPLPAPRRNAARPAAPAAPRLHSAILLALAYALGPAALVLTGRGRSSGSWVGLGMVCAAATLAVVGGWWSFARGEVPALLLPALVAGSALTVVVAATVWSRALHLLLTARRFPARPWPAWLQNPWLGLVAGLAAPGSAMALARRPRLAALTAWWTWPGLVAIVALVQSPVVWRHREAFGRWRISSDALEYVMILAVLAVVVAAAFWVSQALLGARLLALRAGRWQSTRGDWTGVGLAMAVVVFLVVLQPGVVATDLAVYASALADAEYQVIPVTLNLAAQRLDPGQVAYALQGVELHAARGDLAAAQGAREDLYRRMRPYLGLLAAGVDPVATDPPPAPLMRQRGLPSPLVRPAAGVEPAPPPVGPKTAPSSESPAASSALLFGPGLVLAEEAGPEQRAPADSLP